MTKGRGERSASDRVEAAPLDAKTKARVALMPSLQGAFTLEQVHRPTLGSLELHELLAALNDQAKGVSEGDLARPEAMLMTQASTLDALFNELTRRAMSAEYLPHYDAYLRMALKAQAQARATVEALAELKNPRPVLIAKQANVGGNVQVNNGVPAVVARARKTSNPPTELLENDHGQVTRLVAGATSTTGRTDPNVEAVDPIHRSANG